MTQMTTYVHTCHRGSDHAENIYIGMYVAQTHLTASPGATKTKTTEKTGEIFSSHKPRLLPIFVHLVTYDVPE